MLYHYEPGLTVELVGAYRNGQRVYIVTQIDDTGTSVWQYENSTAGVIKYNKLVMAAWDKNDNGRNAAQEQHYDHKTIPHSRT